MRTFIALELPDDLRDEAERLSRHLARRVTGRFVPSENYHLTLAFLGEVGEADSRAVIAAMDEVAAAHGPVSLSPAGLGTFGRSNDCTLWLGLAPSPALTSLASALRSSLDAAGISYDRKAFRPHITLARRARLPKGPLPSLTFPIPIEARHMTFFKSILDPDGATYKPLYTVELGHGGAAEA